MLKKKKQNKNVFDTKFRAINIQFKLIILIKKKNNNNKKPEISNLVRTARFWNNLHQIRAISKYCKVK